MVCTAEQLLESGPALFLSLSSVRNGDWLTTLDFSLHLAEGRSFGVSPSCLWGVTSGWVIVVKRSKCSYYLPSSVV